jgi:hypothetical protein
MPSLSAILDDKDLNSNIPCTLLSDFSDMKRRSSEPFSENSTSELDFETMQEIIDKRNFCFDGVEIDGVYNPSNPLAFHAAIPSNKDILIQSQILKTDDQDNFVECQENEIKGLNDAEVFGFLEIDKRPNRARLFNAIWSYRRKRRPDGSLHGFGFKGYARLTIQTN